MNRSLIAYLTSYGFSTLGNSVAATYRGSRRARPWCRGWHAAAA
ncbi:MULTISPECIES: hypothetical protein [unclassified Streptomyces]